MTPIPTTTFVTAYYNIYNTTNDIRGIEWRKTQFQYLLDTGIQICLFTDKQSVCQFTEFDIKYENLFIIDSVRFDELLVCRLLNGLEYELPSKRNEQKDSKKYLLLMNSKTDFVNRAVNIDPFHSLYFAWIDFSIAYIFKNKNITLKMLSYLSFSRNIQDSFLLVPGCYNVMEYISPDFLGNEILWRYCGGFFIGSRDRLKQMLEAYKLHFINFVVETKRLTWEVNMWCWFEYKKLINIDFYLSDHNDKIINIPSNYLVYPLENNTIIEYEYPYRKTYEPSSASYIYYKHQHILNTRYVNYWYNDDGTMLINDKHNVIKTINILSVLNDELLPQSFCDKEENLCLTKQPSRFLGLEDIRLFEYKDDLYFIATTAEYSLYPYNSMIMGKYSVKDSQYSDVKVLGSPHKRLEKNWIPIIRKGELEFIYSWYPLQIGKLDENNNLIIHNSFPIKNNLFKIVRGSTCFINDDDVLLGIAHFSMNATPRKYFHMLIALDKDTLRPLYHSNSFYFLNVGIEYCIGFTAKEENFIFWISQNDREPCMIKVPKTAILLKYSL